MANEFISHDDMTPFGPDDYNKLLEHYREHKVRIASDALLDGSWQGLKRSIYPEPLKTPLTATEVAMRCAEIVARERQLEEARERARLTVLNLTKQDRRFLRALKIAYW